MQQPMCKSSLLAEADGTPHSLPEPTPQALPCAICDSCNSTPLPAWQQAVCRLPEAPADPASCLHCMQTPEDAFTFQIPSQQPIKYGERRWGGVQ